MDPNTRSQRNPPIGNVKVTREDWLALALKTVRTQGVENVRILPMSQALGVSRASFYWYFESRQGLLDQLLRHWGETNTRSIVEGAGRPAKTITRSVLYVFECWVDENLFDPQLDFAVRAWARRSAAVRRAIDDADEQRVDALRQMFLKHGYEKADAFVRARVLYFMQIGYYVLELQEPLDQRLSYVADYLRSFTGREPVDDEVAAFAAIIDARRKTPENPSHQQ